MGTEGGSHRSCMNISKRGRGVPSEGPVGLRQRTGLLADFTPGVSDSTAGQCRERPGNGQGWRQSPRGKPFGTSRMDAARGTARAGQ